MGTGPYVNVRPGSTRALQEHWHLPSICTWARAPGARMPCYLGSVGLSHGPGQILKRGDDCERTGVAATTARLGYRPASSRGWRAQGAPEYSADPRHPRADVLRTNGAGRAVRRLRRSPPHGAGAPGGDARPTGEAAVRSLRPEAHPRNPHPRVRAGRAPGNG